MKLLILLIPLALAGCTTENESLKVGSYIAYRIQQDNPEWVKAHCPISLDEATVRVYKDIEHGYKVSEAIAKQCK